MKTSKKKGKKKKEDVEVFKVSVETENEDPLQQSENVKNLNGVGEDAAISKIPIDKKFEAFGWDFSNVDGHDFRQLRNIFNEFSSKANGKPKVVIAKTIKGKGVSFMENSVPWHYKPPNKEDLNEALNQIENA